MTPSIIVSSPHLELHDHTREEISKIAEKLFRHNVKIVRLKIVVDRVAQETRKAYSVRISIEMRGPDVSVAGEHEHLLPAAHHAVDLAERKLTERMRSKDERRHHPHAVDLAADIPKTSHA